jgi:hypothetical protein
MAEDLKGPAAARHAALLFRPLGIRWHAGAHPHHALYVKCREQVQRQANPTGGDVSKSMLAIGCRRLPDCQLL